jgi:hypothetical protein
MENGGWEGIVMWDKGVCLPHVITFTITVEKMAMECAPSVVVNYKCLTTHHGQKCQNAQINFWLRFVVNSNTILLHLNIFGVVEIVGILTSLEL